MYVSVQYSTYMMYMYYIYIYVYKKHQRTSEYNICNKKYEKI